MAKSKNTINVDVNVNGRGTKKTTLQMKNLGEQTNKASKSTGDFNRNMKGASKQSSGASKNFSKMSQGMGGIVGAYATLAANIFAIGAAFRFLESAGDLQKLKEGQILYASATGVALKSLTNDIIAATDAQITFTNASQAAAIGKAAGLTNDQLVRLGKGAKDVSIILGRDVTDSFNRLVRGVTKAEPELLDELGIILRLADASEKYGASIGKSAQDLTQFEKSQAVTLEVLEQVESKYGRVMAVMAPSGNQFTKLGKSFDDIVNKIKEFAAAVATPIAGVLTKQPMLIIGILVALGNTLVKTGLQSWTKNAGDAAQAYAGDLIKARLELEKLQTAQARRAQIAISAKGRLQDLATGENAISSKGKIAGPAFVAAAAGKELNDKQIASMKGVIDRSKTLTDAVKAQWHTALNDVQSKTKAATKNIQYYFQQTIGYIAVQRKKLAVGWAATMEKMKSVTAGFGMVVTKLLGWVSMLSILYTMGKAAIAWGKGLSKASTALDSTISPMDLATEKVKGLNEEFSKFNAVQEIITEDGAGFLQFFEALGNKVGQLSISMQKILFDQAAEGMKGFLAMSVAEFNAVQDTIAMKASKGNWMDMLPGGGKAGGMVLSEINDEITRLEGVLRGMAEGIPAPWADWSATWIGLTKLPFETINFGDAKWQIVMDELTVKVDKYKAGVEEANQATLAFQGDLMAYMKISGNEGLEEFAEFLEGMRESADIAASAFKGDATNAITEYVDVLNELDSMGGKDIGTPAWHVLIENIFAAQVAAQEYGAIITSVRRLQKDNSQESSKLLQDVQKRSTEGRMVDNLQQELDLRQKLASEGLIAPAGMGPEETKAFNIRTTRINLELTLFKRIDKAKRDAEKRTKATAIVERKQLLGATKLVATRIKLQMQQMKLDDKVVKVNDEILQIKEKIMLNQGEVEPQQVAMLENLVLEEESLRLQNDLLKRKLDYTMQIKDAAAQAFESGLQKTFSQFIKGEESSLREGMLKLAQGVLGAIADTLSKQMTEAVMGVFGIKTEAQIMKEGMIEAAEVHTSMLIAGIQEEYARQQANLPQFMPGGQTPDLRDAGFVNPGQDAYMPGALWNPDTKAVDTVKKDTTLSVLTEIQRNAVLAHTDAKFAAQEFVQRLNTPILAEVTNWPGQQPTDKFKSYDRPDNDRPLWMEPEIPSVMQERPANSVIGAAQKSSSPSLNTSEIALVPNPAFLEGLTGLFGEGNPFTKGLGGLFGSIFDSMGGAGSIINLLTAADGGVLKGGFRKYANGGIATSPTLGLVGEGKHNEAIVPLPNGRSIPVDMKSSAQTNNITVNVSAEGQTQVEGGDSEGLGKAIARAVQSELQNQKRSGGILSPYGVA